MHTDRTKMVKKKNWDDPFKDSKRAGLSWEKQHVGGVKLSGVCVDLLWATTKRRRVGQKAKMAQNEKGQRKLTNSAAEQTVHRWNTSRRVLQILNICSQHPLEELQKLTAVCWSKITGLLMAEKKTELQSEDFHFSFWRETL